MFLPLSLKSLGVKVGGAMILAATSDAVVGAAATVIVGFLAAMSAIAVAWLQARSNRQRDEAIKEVVSLTKDLEKLQRERTRALEKEVRRLRAERGEDAGETSRGS